MVAVTIVVLSFSAFIIGVIYSLPPARADLNIVGEDPHRPAGDLMILCPSKASEKGLCSVGERDLHAKYTAKLYFESSPPKVNPRVTCRVDQSTMPPKPSCWPSCSTEILIPTIDRTSNFTCDLVQTDEDRFELDLVLIANPDDTLLIAPYFLEVTINYDEPLLPFGLLTRSVMSGFRAAHLCILGYHTDLGPTLDCERAALSQRKLLGISAELSCRPGLSTIPSIADCQISDSAKKADDDWIEQKSSSDSHRDSCPSLLCVHARCDEGPYQSFSSRLRSNPSTDVPDMVKTTR